MREGRMSINMITMVIFNHKGGQQSTIKTDSKEENIIANKLELGCSFTKTWYWVNYYQAAYGDVLVTCLEVVSAYNRMEKKSI